MIRRLLLVCRGGQSRLPGTERTCSVAGRRTLFCSVWALLLGGCEQQGSVYVEPTMKVGEDPLLVEVGEKKISVSDYHRYFARVPAEVRKEFPPDQFLTAMVDEELLVQEAMRRGLGQTPAFIGLMARDEEQLVQRALYQQIGIVQPQIAEAELQAFFQQSPYNRRVRFSLLMVRDEAQIAEILAELERGADFEDLSLRRSQDPRILERHADMGYHRWGDTMASHAALTEQAFTMQPGEVFGPMQVADGYFLIKLTDVHPVSFEQERETIKHLVLREKLGRQLLSYFDTLHVRYKVEYIRSGLESLAAVLAAEDSMAAATRVVASYTGGTVTLGRALKLLHSLTEKGVVGEETLRREVGRQVLVPLEVERLGLKEDPALAREVERVRRAHIVQHLQEELKAQAPPPNPNALSLFYEEYKSRYAEPTQVDVRRLLAESEVEGREIVERMRAGRDTTQLADRFVKVTYGSGAIEGENPVSRVLRSDERTVQGPFATDNGYIVLQVLNRREARSPPLDEVRQRVESDWDAMQIQDLTRNQAADLRQRRAAEIRLHPDAAERLVLSGGLDGN